MSGSSNSTIRMRGSSASFVPEAQDVKPLLVEAEVDVEMSYPTAAAVVQSDPLVPPSASWKDPFYENDPNVIATFTFDYNRIDRGLARTGRCLGGISVLWVVIMIVYPPVSIRTYPSLYPLVAMLPIFLFPCIVLHLSDRYKQNRRRCLHIALTESAVYVDEVSEPGSHELMRRLKYSYSEISRGEVARTDCCCNVTFQVALFNSKSWRILQIDGLMGAQKFVDLVNDMIERVFKDDDQKSSSEPTVFRTLETF